MKIYGKYVKGPSFFYHAADIEDNSRVVMDVDVAYIKTEDGLPVGECKKCFIQVHSVSFSFEILNNNREYLSPQRAKKVIKTLAEKNYINLDEHQMCLYNALDQRKRVVSISNEYDEDANEWVPILVNVEDDE